MVAVRLCVQEWCVDNFYGVAIGSGSSVVEAALFKRSDNLKAAAFQRRRHLKGGGI